MDKCSNRYKKSFPFCNKALSFTLNFNDEVKYQSNLNV